jgi:hypothetical protein
MPYPAHIPTFAQAVAIRTNIQGELKPRRALLIVAEADPIKAEMPVRAHIQPTEIIVGVYPLPEGAIEAFGLQPGEFTAYLGGGLG